MRKISILLVIVMLLTFMASGCSGSNDEVADGDNSSVTSNILGGGATDKWYMLSNGIGEALNRNYPGSVLHYKQGGALSNILNLNDNQAEFALIHTTLVFEAYEGLGQFEEAKDNISTVAVLYPSPAQIIFNKNLGISSFSEIIENKIPVKISVGTINGSTNSTFQKIIKEYGLTFDDMTDWGCTVYQKNFADTTEMFADEAIDGFFIVAGDPTVFVTQLSINSDMVMLEWNQEIINAMVENYGYSNYTIQDDVYTFIEKDMDTFSSNTMLGASLSTPEETVYKITKSIYENLDYIKTLHASFVQISKEIIAGAPGAPLHPGAEKYYKEIGLID